MLNMLKVKLKKLNFVKLNVLIFYYFDFTPLFEFIISLLLYVISTAISNFLHRFPALPP